MEGEEVRFVLPRIIVPDPGALVTPSTVCILSAHLPGGCTQVMPILWLILPIAHLWICWYCPLAALMALIKIKLMLWSQDMALTEQRDKMCGCLRQLAPMPVVSLFGEIYLHSLSQKQGRAESNVLSLYWEHIQQPKYIYIPELSRVETSAPYAFLSWRHPHPHVSFPGVTWTESKRRSSQWGHREQ